MVVCFSVFNNYEASAGASDSCLCSCTMFIVKVVLGGNRRAVFICLCSCSMACTIVTRAVGFSVLYK